MGAGVEDPGWRSLTEAAKAVPTGVGVGSNLSHSVGSSTRGPRRGEEVVCCHSDPVLGAAQVWHTEGSAASVRVRWGPSLKHEQEAQGTLGSGKT